MSGAAYIENHPYAAAWLRNLIAAGDIAPGEVIERDIRDIRPDELSGFTQVHAFAGIGVWSYALRCAGWPDDRPVWTASCPCQPFSPAGRGEGLDDERHLWPHFFHLLCHGKSRDIPLLGEQVASTDGLAWLDLVCDDLEAQAHACWAVDFCAASVGAPHIRQRQYFLALAFEHLNEGAVIDSQRLVDGIGKGLEGHSRDGHDRDKSGRVGAQPDGSAAETSAAGGVAIANGDGRGTGKVSAGPGGQGRAPAVEPGPCLRMAKSNSDAGQQVTGSPSGNEDSDGRAGRYRSEPDSHHGPAGHGKNSLPGPVNGFWSNADWLLCRDGQWRPVESGTFPLVDGASFKLGSGSALEGKSRAEMLRGYGNAINKDQAQAFIESAMEVLPS